MSAANDHLGLPEDVQRAIEYAGALAGQYAQSQAFDRQESIKSVILQQFGAAYATPLRARNARATCTLPNELWITTWSLLDTSDLLNASYVCHGWRRLAVSTPSLWTSVVLTCDLRQQDNDADFFHLSVEAGTYVTNLPLAQHLLSRTQNLPVSVCVTTSDLTYFPHYLEEVSNLLRVCHSRVVRLDVRCGHSAFFNDLIHLSPQLPSLRVLTLDDNGSDSGVADSIFYEAVEFPSLEVLTISPGFAWDPSADLLFPSLRKLSLCLYDCDELGSALSACPALRQLHIIAELPPGDADEGSWDLTIGPDLRKISTVSIELVAPANEYGIAEIFEHAPGTDLELVYPHSSPRPPALRLLRSLVKPIRVSCTITEGRRLRAAFSDASRKVSFVWGLNLSAQQTWDQLPPAAVVQLEADAELWPGVLDSLPDIGSIDELTLRLHSTENFHRISQDSHERHILPSISTLRLHGQCPGIVADVPGVIALVDRFTLGRPLRTLEVKRSRVEGCLPDLSALADDLRLG